MKIQDSTISTREREVLFLIAKEHNTPEIAKQLFVSAHTVISHRRSLMRKLRARNAAGMIYRAFQFGILSCTFMESSA
jgi:DNA-binding CsgD family transcriptional regulator